MPAHSGGAMRAPAETKQGSSSEANNDAAAPGDTAGENSNSIAGDGGEPHHDRDELPGPGGDLHQDKEEEGARVNPGSGGEGPKPAAELRTDQKAPGVREAGQPGAEQQHQNEEVEEWDHEMAGRGHELVFGATRPLFNPPPFPRPNVARRRNAPYETTAHPERRS